MKLAVNQDSVRLFEDLIRACQELDGTALDVRLRDLGEHEHSRRDEFQRHLCSINQTLHDYALGSVGLIRREQRPTSPRRGRSGLPGHAAAALLAAGLLACSGESSGTGTTPDAGNAGKANLGGQGGATAAGGYVNAGGMFEAPPPPMGGSASSGGARATGGRANTGGYVNAGGMFEAPPPPM